jgi:hypothetical protein
MKQTAQIYDDKDLLRRAYAAYYRGPGGNLRDIPASDSGVELHDGKYYVVLRNIHGVLAVYRVRSDGILKGLRRYPKTFDTE